MKKRKGVRPKGQMNMSFGIIFAIIAGAFILFLAIYAAVKLTGIETTAIEGETTRTIAILTNPLESSFESTTITTINAPSETRIYTNCSEPNDKKKREIFGRQQINTSQKTYGKWTESEIGNVGFSNKYIFSENPSQGKKFYVFSMQFEFPYKIADLIYVLPSESKYCFIGTNKIRRGELEEEIENLNQPSLLVEDELEDCPEESVKICFHGYDFNDCDININYDAGYFIKDGKESYFPDDSLMLAAILSDKKTYECQLKRLMKRGELLSEIYIKKYDLMTEDLVCDSGVKSDLMYYNLFLQNYKDSSQMGILKEISDDLRFSNERSDCSLW